jgi:thioesterase domain-containing protein
MAEAINAHFTPDDSVFVPLREAAPGSPVLLLVAGAGGHVFSFLNFARALPFEATVYGIKPFGLNNIDELPATFEAMATKYIADLEKICPDGPFIVSGYSIGARMAYEIARQMEILNKPLLGFISLDMPAPGFPPRQSLASCAGHRKEGNTFQGAAFEGRTGIRNAPLEHHSRLWNGEGFSTPVGSE